MRKFMTLLVLAAAWLLWSGLYKPLLLGLGLFSCLLVLVVAQRTGFFQRDAFSLHLTSRLMLYWAWLLKELVKSNLAIARIVLSPSLSIQPQVVKVDASHFDRVGQAILGNSITLTPGTLTMDTIDGQLTVHCLTDATAADLLGGEMIRRLAAAMRA
jgi:multicomponent Na+:H+ antiporter subunit E